MTRVILKALWLVMPVRNPTALFDVEKHSREFDCYLSVIGQYPFLKREDGCHIIPCMINAASWDVFKIWREKIEIYIQFADFQEISPTDIADSTSELHSIPLVDFAETLDYLGKYNEAVLNNTLLWASYHWIVKPLSYTEINNAVELLNSGEYSLYYTQPEQNRSAENVWTITFFLKIPDVTAFEKFKSLFNQYIHTDKWSLWHWLFKSNTPDLQNTVMLTQEKVHEFYQLVKDHS
jgi:hypothetical protein